MSRNARTRTITTAAENRLTSADAATRTRTHRRVIAVGTALLLCAGAAGAAVASDASDASRISAASDGAGAPRTAADSRPHAEKRRPPPSPAARSSTARPPRT